MSVLRLLLSALMIVGGIVIALLVMAVGLFVFLLQRLIGRPATMPRFQRVNRRPPTQPNQRDEVIDIDATPVKD